MCAKAGTSDDHFELMGSSPSMAGAVGFTIARYELTMVVAGRASKKQAGSAIQLSVPPHPVRLPPEKTHGDQKWKILAIAGSSSPPAACSAASRSARCSRCRCSCGRSREDTGWSITGISSAMTIGFLAMALRQHGLGHLVRPPRPALVVLTGSVLLAASLALASRATSLVAFQLSFGAGGRRRRAAIFAPMMACVTGWFDTHRSLAVSLVSAGMGMAPMTMSPLAAWLVAHHDWRTSLQIIAAHRRRRDDPGRRCWCAVRRRWRRRAGRGRGADPAAGEPACRWRRPCARRSSSSWC